MGANSGQSENAVEYGNEFNPILAAPQLFRGVRDDTQLFACSSSSTYSISFRSSISCFGSEFFESIVLFCRIFLGILQLVFHWLAITS